MTRNYYQPSDRLDAILDQYTQEFIDYSSLPFAVKEPIEDARRKLNEVISDQYEEQGIYNEALDLALHLLFLCCHYKQVTMSDEDDN